MVWEVEILADIDWLIKNVCSVMIHSEVQLFGCETHILLVALGACYHIDEVW